MCISPVLSWVLLFLVCSISTDSYKFITLIPNSSLSLEVTDLMETSHLELNIEGLALSSQSSMVSLFVCSHLLHKEASLMMVKQDTDL